MRARRLGLLRGDPDARLRFLDAAARGPDAARRAHFGDRDPGPGGRGIGLRIGKLRFCPVDGDLIVARVQLGEDRSSLDVLVFHHVE